LANPNVREVQVWNREYWTPDPTDAQGRGIRTRKTAYEYLRLLAKTYDAVHSLGVLVLGPGAHPGYGHQFAFIAAVKRYYQRTHRRKPLMDGYAVHPYWNFSRHSTRIVARQMDRAWRSLPQTSPSRGLRFWWTETGMESRSPALGYFGTPNAWPHSARMLGTPEEQANRVATVAMKARANPLVAADFNFELGDVPNLWDWQSGLYFVDGEPKPAFYLFRDAIWTGR
jgi:hypothetical protein